MAFPYKKILLIGATSGIGRALGASLIQHGRFVIAVGRRQENLDRFVQEHGTENAAGIQFDINKLNEIPQFVKSVTSSHPDLDCVFVNSGMQRRSVFTEPESISIDEIQAEMTVNYISYVSLTKEFLPFFMAKENSLTSFIFTSSNLALVPILRCSNYCASKAALHQQITNRGFSVAELHDEKNQPDMAHMRGRAFGIPVDQFTTEAMKKLLAGDDQIPVGLSTIAFDSWEQQRQQAFHRVVEMMRKGES
ncbi:hypothetical protein AnigIFM63326_002350 [Aspergillus niger]|nr:hypothetical protein AnigIFM63326_002350 [Aspergillus niger]